jgi:hypothetical protein
MRLDHRQLDVRRLGARVEDALGCLLMVARLGEKDVGNEGLRVAVVEREPARLDLHHDPMAGLEDAGARKAEAQARLQIERLHLRCAAVRLTQSF